MAAFVDLITPAYAKTIAGITTSTTAKDIRIAALVTACSLAAATFCNRNLMPAYYDELYAPSGQGFLVLRTSPLIRVEEVVIGPSTTDPQTYDADDFDIDPYISKIAFKPTTVADFFFDSTTTLAFPSGVNTVEAKYYGGYGALLTVADAVAIGSVTVTPNAMYGLTVYGEPWAITVGAKVIVDAGLATEEVVTVNAVTTTTFTAIFTRAHAANARLLLPQAPMDLQLAVGLMVSNLARQTDLTKQSEHLGDYSYTLRPNQMGLVYTPEVMSILNRYKAVFAG